MFLRFLKQYFLESDDRYIAWLLLFGTTLSVVGTSWIFVMLNASNALFWTALTEVNSILFVESLQTFAFWAIALASCYSVKEYLQGVLAIRWRNWLTKKLLNDYMKNDANNYLNIAREPTLRKVIDNPGQRIESDISAFVSQTVSLFFDFILNFLLLFTSISIAWSEGGFYVIAGMLLFSASLFAVNKYIGRDLSSRNQEQQKQEANLRLEIELMNKQAESVALEGGEKYFHDSFLSKLYNICKLSYGSLAIRVRLNGTNYGAQWIASLIPDIIPAPLYFSKAITIATLRKISSALSQMQRSFDWFSNNYETLTNHRANMERIAKLDDTLSEKPKSTTAHLVKVQHSKRNNDLIVNNLSLTDPTGKNLFQNLSLRFKEGENTVINGRAGIGKSTLLKAIAKKWMYGHGDIKLPSKMTVYYLPQHPMIPPNATLRTVLAYPHSNTNKYTNEQYIQVLEAISGLTQFKHDLDTHHDERDWSSLSGGQKQLIAFARALLHQPKWLVLDEATSALDLESEAEMYQLLKKQLPTTTLISIAHRPTVIQPGDRVVTLVKKPDDSDQPKAPQSASSIRTGRLFNRRPINNTSSHMMDQKSVSNHL